MNAFIEAVGVGVRLHDKVLIEDVSLQIAPGSAVAMIGPNGAGKSTLLRVISGDRAPSAGVIRLKGRAPADYASRELALRRAVLAQSVSVAFPFSVVEVVRMGAGERTGPAIEAMVEAALSEVDLLGLRDRIVNTLSGGEQQRTHFARVMVQLACGEARIRPGLAVARRADIEPRPSPPARSFVRSAALRCPRCRRWWRCCTISISRRCSPIAFLS